MAYTLPANIGTLSNTWHFRPPSVSLCSPAEFLSRLWNTSPYLGAISIRNHELCIIVNTARTGTDLTYCLVSYLNSGGSDVTG